MDFKRAEKAIGYKFKNKELLKRALTLASYDYKNNNEALEFFGDAIIEFIVSERIFKLGADEGELTERRKSLVCDKSLTRVAQKLGLDTLLIKGEGDTRNKKAVPSSYEAIAAAIYLDGGIKPAKKFILTTLDFSYSAEDENYKGKLQEALQKLGYECPQYRSRNVGTPQSPAFVAEVSAMGKIFTGRDGGRQQNAEQQAAKSALEELKKDGRI